MRVAIFHNPCPFTQFLSVASLCNMLPSNLRLLYSVSFSQFFTLKEGRMKEKKKSCLKVENLGEPARQKAESLCNSGVPPVPVGRTLDLRKSEAWGGNSPSQLRGWTDRNRKEDTLIYEHAVGHILWLLGIRNELGKQRGTCKIVIGIWMNLRNRYNLWKGSIQVCYIPRSFIL